ncbi:MAG: glycoside hydrolase family 88 protein [Butyrivibrio sp.]|nr:glycoside hydrolase family 88 protein [Butyrivibrio sp.]
MPGNKKEFECYENLVKESIRELNDIMNVSFKEQVKDTIKSAMGRSVRSKDPMFWHAGMLMLGLSEARKNAGFDLKNKIDAAILDHLRLWRGKYGGRIDYVDDALAGAALLKIYEQCMKESASHEEDTQDRNIVEPSEKDTQEKNKVGSYVEGAGEHNKSHAIANENHGRTNSPRIPELADECKNAADRIYKYLLQAPRDVAGTIVYNYGRSANVFADGVGQCSMFLSMYGKCFGDKKALELAKVQLINFRKYGMDFRSGLPYHGYELITNAIAGSSNTVKIKHCVSDEQSKDSTESYSGDTPSKDEKKALSADDAGQAGVIKKGVLSWGRAAGWLIMGLSEYVDAANKLQYTDPENLTEWYGELTKTLLSYQRPGGGFSWQVQAVDGPLDTSATGMIMYGILRGADELDASAATLYDSIDSSGRVQSALSSCDDFGVHYQTYGHFPWGQGAALAALSAMLLKDTE